MIPDNTIVETKKDSSTCPNVCFETITNNSQQIRLPLRFGKILIISLNFLDLNNSLNSSFLFHCFINVNIVDLDIPCFLDTNEAFPSS